ncbi:PAQR family membrane homeostasis protein TrhA [Paenibacillus mucilaginosus]|uniref:Channel protein, hemolysin III family n=1 Tax=Paenibacillus mucilaginosus (strain KNP414) TaxID=1036673 RepID=F8F8M1_PAEMK|nr:hemolysin III family protein [Paenibacillus mucilaginosus]AEI41609.1 channel protein, hemolysin III family [Paenibacillus mucilaginosus KNP414]MCG7214315.1 hemolysin III family protein [Paenibacillus mucilaginosus]WDM30603.1 hemolysin III family protein [Paenibacillus mucilaginosus]
MEPSILRQERANAISHGVGILLSIAGLVLLILQAVQTGNVWHIASFTVFGLSLILLYTASTLLHSARREPWVSFFEVLDHSAIYVLIAGTYTPYLLVTIRGPLGWSLFGTVWGMALLGIIFKFFFVKKFNFLSTLFYIGMGWMIIFAFEPLQQQLSAPGVMWLVIGGVLYTFGTVFYLWRRLPYHHMIWHLFVLAGSVCHFISVYLYV